MHANRGEFFFMQQHGIQRILSFDRGSDGFPGITRLS
jgi:predicted nucleic acid-binding protein